MVQVNADVSWAVVTFSMEKDTTHVLVRHDKIQLLKGLVGVRFDST